MKPRPSLRRLMKKTQLPSAILLLGLSGQAAYADTTVDTPPPPSRPCACSDISCQMTKADQKASNDFDALPGTVALVGALGVGGFAYTRRKPRGSSKRTKRPD